MQTRKLGGLDVNVIGMGTSLTFQVTSEEDIAVRRRIIDNCLSWEATFVDSSPMYGESEEVLGITMEGKRQGFQLATKVWCEGRANGEEQIARSFRLMRTDFVDVFQIHNMVDWQGHLPTLERLKAEGKIGQIGITANYSEPECVDIMKSRRIDTIQIPYHPLEKSCELSILPLAADLGMGVIIMTPFGNGKLVRGLRRQPDIAPLREYGIRSWPQALLAWIIADERVGVVIPATSSPERVIENAQAGWLPPLPSEMRDYISKEAERCA